MSALGQKRTLRSSFDHFVGATQKRRRKHNFHGLRSIEIDDEFEPARKGHRQVTGFFAFQYSTSMEVHKMGLRGPGAYPLSAWPFWRQPAPKDRVMRTLTCWERFEARRIDATNCSNSCKMQSYRRRKLQADK